MIIDILTLFPEMFAGPFDTSIIKMAKEKQLVEINIHNLRDWAIDKHKKVDSRPFGGGKGMVLKVDVIDNALNSLRKNNSKVVLMSPQGKTFRQEMAKNFTADKHLILIAGHYEGFDERVRYLLIDEEISIGNYVLTGGELPAMVLTDAIVRLIPGVLSEEAVENESHSSEGSVDYPQYTHPRDFKGKGVPEVLFSGNHEEIRKWRLIASKKKAKKR